MEMNREYTYQEICENKGWKVSTGKSKILQLRKIENEYEYYQPMNIKTHKPKKSYVFTKVRDNPLPLASRGGSRNGAGRHSKLDEEFMTVISYLIHHYNVKYCFNDEEIYFSKDEICKFFGVYNNIYNLDYEKYDRMVTDNIIVMLNGRANSIIFDKLEKCKSVKYSQGILLNGTRRDDLLGRYSEYEQQYLDAHGYLHTGQVARCHKWNEMTQYILGELNLNPYMKIRKCYKIQFDQEDFADVAEDEYIKSMQMINEYVVRSITASVRKKYSDENTLMKYKLIISDCIKMKRRKSNGKI